MQTNFLKKGLQSIVAASVLGLAGCMTTLEDIGNSFNKISNPSEWDGIPAIPIKIQNQNNNGYNNVLERTDYISSTLFLNEHAKEIKYLSNTKS